jgi:hypothetical protein
LTLDVTTTSTTGINNIVYIYKSITFISKSKTSPKSN